MTKARFIHTERDVGEWWSERLRKCLFYIQLKLKVLRIKLSPNLHAYFYNGGVGRSFACAHTAWPWAPLHGNVLMNM